MMGFSMRCCTSVYKLGRIGLAISSIWLCIAIAYAEGIDIKRAEIRYTEDGYQLAADFKINLTFYVEQALTRGITLNFLTEFKVTQSRWYWLDEVVMEGEQTTKLSYNPLTRQYRIARGALFQNFDSLEEALIVLGHQTTGSIAPEQLRSRSGYIASVIRKDPVYSAYTRFRLDTSQLPKPLQVNALAGNDWSLDSGGYSWALTPAAISAARIAAP